MASALVLLYALLAASVSGLELAPSRVGALRYHRVGALARTTATSGAAGPRMAADEEKGSAIDHVLISKSMTSAAVLRAAGVWLRPLNNSDHCAVAVAVDIRVMLGLDAEVLRLSPPQDGLFARSCTWTMTKS